MKTLIKPQTVNSRNGVPGIKSLVRSFLPLLICAVVAGNMLSSCTTLYSSRAEYFGYRNNLPVPPDDGTMQQGNFNGSAAWTNPMNTQVVSSVAFVPIITPWYDSWSFYVRPSLRFRMWYDPFWGGGFGWGSRWAWYDPFWDGGFGSSFMYYSCPWYNFNPYFGGFTPFGFYRPLGWWSSRNFASMVNYGTIINNFGTGGGNDRWADPQLRSQSSQRSYSTVNNGSTTYIGAYDGGGYGGGRSRADGNAYYSSASSSISNKASWYNTSTYSSGSGAVYDNTRYGGGRSSGGYNNTYRGGSTWFGGGNNSGGSYNSGGRSSGGYGGGYGGGGYSGSSSSSGSSSGGGGKSTGGYGGGKRP